VAANTFSQKRLAILDVLSAKPLTPPRRGVAFDQKVLIPGRISVVMGVEAPSSVSTKVCDSVSNRLVVPYQANLLAEYDSEVPKSPSKVRRTNEFRPSAATIQIVIRQLIHGLDQCVVSRG